MMEKGLGEEVSRMVEHLKKRLDGKDYAVAYSGGVDSSLLLKLLHMAFGDGGVAFLILNPLFPEVENLKEMRGFASSLGFELILIEDEILEEAFLKNLPDRCYYCRRGELERAKEVLKERGIETIVDGVNVDDLKDYRPGLKAAEEFKVIHPYVELGWGKRMIRDVASYLSLPISEKPSSPCLASRIAYGTPINSTTLHIVREAERMLKEKGFSQVRARLHSFEGPLPQGGMKRVFILRIEVPLGEEIKMIGDRELIERLKRLGIDYVTLDLEGFRSGSMNEYFFSREEE
ncbi:MAG: ATP-dependent sacrificial sulfur transferase LarE [Thermoplasmata archaeon]|nr:ATP-dependent sacrificial sulfur transferase LarE [Thermoplasmata archaeon]